MYNSTETVAVHIPRWLSVLWLRSSSPVPALQWHPAPPLRTPTQPTTNTSTINYAKQFNKLLNLHVHVHNKTVLMSCTQFFTLQMFFYPDVILCKYVGKAKKTQGIRHFRQVFNVHVQSCIHIYKWTHPLPLNTPHQRRYDRRSAAQEISLCNNVMRGQEIS